ncbi:MAG: hypothetical protein R3E79_54975 [Caldilineaceae bacterium]
MPANVWIRRIDSQERLEQEVLTLVEERNRQAATVRWQFTPNWRVSSFNAFTQNWPPTRPPESTTYLS